MDMQKKYIIRETENYYPLSVFFHECGMEIDIMEKTPDGMIKMWRMEDSATGELIAAVTFQIRDGVYCLGSLAVRADQRCKGYGRMLQNLVFDEARKIGVKELWANAKIPEYYHQIGWKDADWNSSPRVALKCHICGKRGKTCHPSIIHMNL